MKVMSLMKWNSRQSRKSRFLVKWKWNSLARVELNYSESYYVGTNGFWARVEKKDKFPGAVEETNDFQIKLHPQLFGEHVVLHLVVFARPLIQHVVWGGVECFRQATNQDNLLDQKVKMYGLQCLLALCRIPPKTLVTGWIVQRLHKLILKIC